jgi:hypothetical protein
MDRRMQRAVRVEVLRSNVRSGVWLLAWGVATSFVFTTLSGGNWLEGALALIQIRGGLVVAGVGLAVVSARLLVAYGRELLADRTFSDVVLHGPATLVERGEVLGGTSRLPGRLLITPTKIMFRVTRFRPRAPDVTIDRAEADVTMDKDGKVEVRHPRGTARFVVVAPSVWQRALCG